MSQFKLQLDQSALKTLFPEGSEARLDLQRSVMVAFTKQYIKPAMVTEEVERIVNRERLSTIAEALGELGITRPTFNGKYLLSDDLKSSLRAQARQGIDEQIEEEVQKSVKHVLEGLDEKIQRYVDRAVEQGASRIVKERLEAAMKMISS